MPDNVCNKFCYDICIQGACQLFCFAGKHDGQPRFALTIEVVIQFPLGFSPPGSCGQLLGLVDNFWFSAVGLSSPSSVYGFEIGFYLENGMRRVFIRWLMKLLIFILFTANYLVAIFAIAISSLLLCLWESTSWTMVSVLDDGFLPITTKPLGSLLLINGLASILCLYLGQLGLYLIVRFLPMGVKWKLTHLCNVQSSFQAFC